ncbi:hypothetical protein Tsubulata_049137 [Turnera subulata]|uniref:chitinase n=1 Tax=Turnera subulata TaxID=218843 RepID=A0A9Q0FBT7_9ROSI|nr:hypothetical protein Tsubulata_049137 [Turnera subulata]
MASQSHTPFHLLCALLVLSLCKPSYGSGIVIYWGQNNVIYPQPYVESSLEETCRTGLYSFVNIAFLNTFGAGTTPDINLSNHCGGSWKPCTFLSTEIEYCQSQGIKVFISLGGDSWTYTLIDEEDAKDVAKYLWEHFLGGQPTDGLPRPFGDAILDGVDFDIEHGSTQYYDSLAKYLHSYDNINGSRVYLGAAPQCPIPDLYLDTAIKTGLFDYVWTQFYNNPQCQYDSSTDDPTNLLQSWNKWISLLDQTGNPNTKLFLGLPAAATNAAPSGGYIPPEKLAALCPSFSASERYGGIMLWSRYFDGYTGYGQQVDVDCDSGSLSRANTHGHSKLIREFASSM